MKPNYDYLLKYTMVGDAFVGKTYIAFHYQNEKFLNKCQITIEVDFQIKDYSFNNKKYRLQIWDTSGIESFRSINRPYIKKSVCICIVYDVTDRDSFINSKNWIEDCETLSPKTTLFVLIGDKIDLTRKVSVKEGKDLADKYGFLFFETSTKTGTNIKEVFEKSCQEIAKRIVMDFMI